MKQHSTQSYQYWTPVGFYIEKRVVLTGKYKYMYVHEISVSCISEIPEITEDTVRDGGWV